jgi:hypothetical protein
VSVGPLSLDSSSPSLAQVPIAPPIAVPLALAWPMFAEKAAIASMQEALIRMMVAFMAVLLSPSMVRPPRRTFLTGIYAGPGVSVPNKINRQAASDNRQ